MTSMRESPIRREPTARPMWLIVLLVAVGALVLIGLGFGAVSLIRGATSDEPVAGGTSAEPSPCVTTMVIPADVLPAPAKVKVNVYNATGTSGLAGKTATDIESRGFAVVEVANDPVGRPITGVAEIRFGAKGEKSAQVLAFQVPGAELVLLARKGRTVDLAVGDAYTGLAPKADVTAAMAAPSPSASGAGCAPTTVAPAASAG